MPIVQRIKINPPPPAITTKMAESLWDMLTQTIQLPHGCLVVIVWILTCAAKFLGRDFIGLHESRQQRQIMLSETK